MLRADRGLGPGRHGPGNVQVSQDGGTEPAWAPDSGELYYWNGDRFWAADIDHDPGLRVADRELLFEKSMVRYRWHAQYDVHPDGDRFLMVKPDDGQANVRIVQGWARTLEEPGGGRRAGPDGPPRSPPALAPNRRPLSAAPP